MFSYSGALSINALRACVYIYIWQLSSFRASTLWFIDFDCELYSSIYSNTPSLCQFISQENGQNMRILGPLFSYENGCRQLLGVQSINSESFFGKMGIWLKCLPVTSTSTDDYTASIIKTRSQWPSSF